MPSIPFPMGIREASYAMGATKWQTIYKVVLPAAKLGIVDAIVLGMGRAIGETMAVLMVVGNAPVIPDSIASPISTLTSQIALDMSYSSGLHRSALFGHGRGPVYHLRHAGGHRPSDFQEEEGVGYVRFR